MAKIIGECECCCSEDVELISIKNQKTEESEKVCKFCRSTWVFSVYCYPSHYNVDVALMKTLARLYNEIARKIEEQP